MSNRIPYATIVKAKSGDAEAMSKIMRHYERYIIIHSMRVLYDEHGNHYEVLDHELRQRIETKLIFQIISKFDHTKVPSGETIER
jgi:hypothetical protein